MNDTPDFKVLEAADVTLLTREQQAAALFNGTCSLHDFAEKAVCPIIMQQVAKSDYEQALAGSYYRATLLLRGLGRLEDSSNFQIANSVARTVFELLLDMKALGANHSLAAKFFAFTQVARFRKAKQLKQFLDDNPKLDQSPHQHAVQFASDAEREQRIEQLCIQHWGANKNGNPNWPEHWSGKTIAERAHDAGSEYEEIYRSEFFLQSFYVHAGGAGIDSLSRDALICSFGIAHRLIQQLFAEATTVIADEFQLFRADADLRDKLKRASAASGFFAVQALLEQQQVTASGSAGE